MTKEDAMMKGSSLIFPPHIYPDPTDPHQVSSFISSYLRTFIPRGIVNEAMVQTDNQYWTILQGLRVAQAAVNERWP